MSYVSTHFNYETSCKWLFHINIFIITCYSHKTSCKWPCHIGWMLVGWKVDVSCMLIWLPFWMGATSYFLWQKFDATYLEWLN